MKVKKILFIGLSCIGDVVMTTPVLQVLQDQFPDALFDIVSDKRSGDLYSSIPRLNKIFIKDKNKLFRGVPDLLSKLWKIRYDIIVDVRTDGLAYLLRGKKKYTKLSAVSYGPHAVEKTMGVIAKVNKNKDLPLTRLWLKKEHYRYADQVLSGFEKGSVLAVCVGSDERIKRNWTIDKFIDLFEIHRNDFKRLIFFGGETDQKRTEEISKQISMPSIKIMEQDLLKAAAVLERCNIYIGADSGLGHIANAVNTNTIIFFSNARPEHYGPWGNRAINIVAPDNDARNISVSAVSDQVRKILSK